MKRLLKNFVFLPRQTVARLINFYQQTVSPDHSEMGKMKHPHGFCRYYPSCSEYSKQSVTKHGVLKGGFYSLLRILRCNPWSRGGVDQIPLNNKTK
ncbi:MAG: membrane protein insertion efficiency factor YidD [bacterium]